MVENDKKEPIGLIFLTQNFTFLYLPLTCTFFYFQLFNFIFQDGFSVQQHQENRTGIKEVNTDHTLSTILGYLC